ncbi:MAG TPA: 30S ribosomal protein S15 [Thermotogota bacterium]|nr:30S ribosomal protein S15 [Thermotogota bacterium]HNY83135.1 30S ribosomal protein S15 [Thermotogota bacterium]HOD90612.1 30S ribosomal protein S15 [Thermotogota bacterium]HOF23454.1 30S ribosomal protein S15 [Thermotogota bacterium]HOH13145.1 30S ribosomal protein S15 [Thermotogota bacterium]
MMALEYEEKQNIISDFRINDKDTGSIEVQVALLSTRIRQLTEHLKTHPKDYHSRHGLMKLVGKRRRFLNYLKKNRFDVYRQMIEKLGIRR